MDFAHIIVKAGNVELLLSTPICPGKYVIIVGGHVGPVKAAMSKAELVSGIYLIDTHILDNIREDLREHKKESIAFAIPSLDCCSLYDFILFSRNCSCWTLRCTSTTVYTSVSRNFVVVSTL
jgi:hypothetical protein